MNIFDELYDNINIRLAVDADASTVLSWWNDGEIMSAVGFPHGVNSNIDKVMATIDSKRFYIIEYKGEAIGEFYYDIDDDIVSPDWKIALVSNRNKGLGTRAIIKSLGILFKKGFKEARWNTLDTNEIAQHVYVKIGATKSKSNETWVDQVGVSHEIYDFRLTKEEYDRLYI